MRRAIRLAVLFSAFVLLMATDVFACGDKFLVGSRGTRYQRPKNARAASVVIYADPSADGTSRVEAFLNRYGHRATVVTTLDQLSALLSHSRFDVILATKDMTAQVQKLFGGAPDASAIVALDARPNATRLLSAIDKAVENHDQRTRTSS
jgi:hypothetical protein